MHAAATARSLPATIKSE
uniref:Uncharacterized protein n=1 Tax=Anopheles arabiensis TaxID=7173 RepID=A0A182IFM9_ANOAR